MHKIDVNEQFKILLPSLAQKFSLKDFQVKVVENIVEKNNTLCIMPTGGGKSIIYYLAGLISGGITLVVSPLIALICEQEQKLQELGINVLALHSGISSETQFDLLKKFARREINPKFIFVSPEKLATDGFFEYCIKQRKNDITLITIDEVHCVSQWGLNFRPFYRDIPIFLDNVFENHHPKILALTATLNPKELSDIADKFDIRKENILKDNTFVRSEITLNVLKCVDEEEKERKLWDLLKIHKDEKVLVYVYRVQGTRSVQDLCERAKCNYALNATYFHGEMSARERQEVISKFKWTDCGVVFATSAFGMGIDIKDIRVVIHFMIPESLEQYYQEIGRAARDKSSANAYLLYSEKNISVRKDHFIDKSFPTREKLIEVFSNIFKPESGPQTLAYFDDEDTAKCFQYYLAVGIVKVIAKGFASLKSLTNITNNELKRIYDSSKTKGLITSSKRAKVPMVNVINLVYESIVKNEVSAKKIDKSLIIEVKRNFLSEDELSAMERDINQKREYKQELLDFLVMTINSTTNSIQLHQEIGRYLGADKESLQKLYPTEKGDLVRSKSEVIIANLLFSNGLQYEYERELVHLKGKMRPDFTITTPGGKTFYWEHLGMLGTEEYNKSWLYKKDIYDKEFPDMLKVSYEGITINTSAKQIINELKKL